MHEPAHQDHSLCYQLSGSTACPFHHGYAHGLSGSASTLACQALPHLSVMMPLPMSAMIFVAFFIVNSISFRSSTILFSCCV